MTENDDQSLITPINTDRNMDPQQPQISAFSSILHGKPSQNVDVSKIYQRYMEN